MAFLEKNPVGDRGLKGQRKNKFMGRARQTHNITHLYKETEHNAVLNFVILPVGDFYHKTLRTAAEGDKLRFLGGETFVIQAVCPIRIHSKLFRNLCRFRYGVEPNMVLHRWERTAVDSGYTRQSINGEVAVIVFYRIKDKV